MQFNFPYRFGCEFEFTSAFSYVKPLCKEIIKDIYGENKLFAKQTWQQSEKNKKWHLKLDHSTSCELTTPISTKKDFKKIKSVIDLLRNKTEISKNDSVHIHIEVKKIPIYNLIAAWIKIENVITLCYPKHRRYNTYCQKINKFNHKREIALYFEESLRFSEDHHSAFSTHHYQTRGTVEFRMGEGNLSGEDTINFIKFYMLFINYARKIDPIKIICHKNEIKTINDMFQELEIEDPNIIEFIEKRYRLFGKNQAQ